MPIIVKLDVIMARRKMSLNELAATADITIPNLLMPGSPGVFRKIRPSIGSDSGSFNIIATMITDNKETLPIHMLENELLSLVPLDEGDFERLYAVASDPLIWELHPSKDRYKREVFQKFFDGAIESKAAFLVFDCTTNALVGSTRYYDFNPVTSSIAIGYTFLARACWGGAYNKSMKKLMLDYAFTHVDTVLFHIGTQNFRSQKAIVKIGARFLREVDFDYYEKKLPHYEYEIKKQDWQAK